MENQSNAIELRLPQHRYNGNQIFIEGNTQLLKIFLAPNSCVQYYTGVSGTIRSFNYDGTSGRQLSNQDYTICIRTESNFCNIAYSVCTGGVYSITGPTGGSATAAGTPVGAQVIYATKTVFININITVMLFLSIGWIDHL